MSFVERFAAEGWLPVRGVFQPSFIDDLFDEVDKQADVLMDNSSGKCGEVGHGRFMLSVKLDGPFLHSDLYANPMLLGIVRALLGSEFIIDSLTCVLAMPEASDQEMHRDVPMLFPDAADTSWKAPVYGLTAVLPLVDLTPETGTTRVFPRTHRGNVPGQHEDLFIPRGDCFLMDVRLQHQGLANRSAIKRPILYIVYSRPWFTDMTNFARQPRINLEPADARRIPEEHRPLFRRIAAEGTGNESEKKSFEKAG